MSDHVAVLDTTAVKHGVVLLTTWNPILPLLTDFEWFSSVVDSITIAFVMVTAPVCAQTTPLGSLEKTCSIGK